MSTSPFPEHIHLEKGAGAYLIYQEEIASTELSETEIQAHVFFLSQLAQQARELIEKQGGVYNGLQEATNNTCTLIYALAYLR